MIEKKEDRRRLGKLGGRGKWGRRKTVEVEAEEK